MPSKAAKRAARRYEEKRQEVDTQKELLERLQKVQLAPNQLQTLQFTHKRTKPKDDAKLEKAKKRRALHQSLDSKAVKLPQLVKPSETLQLPPAGHLTTPAKPTVAPIEDPQIPVQRLVNVHAKAKNGALGLGTFSLTRDPEINSQRHALPAIMSEQEIVEGLLDHDVVLISGDTGSGKSTQVPQFLIEAGFTLYPGRPKIGVTQPRRVAAMSVSKRVGEELNDPSLVGFQVRHSSSLPQSHHIKFMTDGILLREAQSDFSLLKYSVIVIDEAHERSVNCDILIGLLSRIVRKRRALFESKKCESPLKLLIMSATLRVEDFCHNPNLFPQKVPIIKIDAQTHPVTLHFAKETKTDYLEEAVKKVRKIHKQCPRGSILVFLTGKREVERMCAMLAQKASVLEDGTDSEDEASPLGGESEGEEEETPQMRLSHGESQVESGGISNEEAFNDQFSGGEGDAELIAFPFYAQLSPQAQAVVFEPPKPGERRVIVSTNVAETSLTLPNIRYVVDSGREKRRIYSESGDASEFQVVYISKASANQRAGRCGRLGPGHCYRLYSGAVYTNVFGDYSPVEILEAPLDSTLLFLSFCGITRLSGFPWPTPPLKPALQAAESRLTYLSALEAGKITDYGRALAELPIPPRYAAILLNAFEYSSEVILLSLALAAGFSAGELFLGGHQSPIHFKDDLEKVLFVVCAYYYLKTGTKEKFCQEQHLVKRAMDESVLLIDQVFEIVNTKTCVRFHRPPLCLKFCPKITATQKFELQICVTKAFLDSAAVHSKELDREADCYVSHLFEHPAYIHRESVFYGTKPPILVYNQAVSMGDKYFLRFILPVTPEMLETCRDTPVVDFHEVLTFPAPFYDASRDRCLGYCAVAFKPLSYVLPPIKCELPDTILRYRVFAIAFLEGKILAHNWELCMSPQKLEYAQLNHKYRAILATLFYERICTRAQLVKKWEAEPEFLRPELGVWVKGILPWPIT